MKITADADGPVVFFPTPAAFRRWLARHHAKRTVLRVGYYKKASGKRSITWPESVDEALCYGWIDGRRRSIDETSYEIRFTPRRRSSHWSAVNVKRFAELEKAGRTTDAGRAAFAKREGAKTGGYGHERRQPAQLTRAEKALFRKDKRAWSDFSARAPGYQRLATHWVVSAKRADTRARRLQILIDRCRDGEVIPPFEWSKAGQKKR